MFNSQRYITRGVQSEIPTELQLFMWNLIDSLPEPKDYLQVFRLFSADGKQHITHEQECPAYKREYVLNLNPTEHKVYVIDDGDHYTILLADEY